ncbi:hypothetical protein J2S74_002062 [Evansella vedderi]|uniref:LPXTG cell wall anchor domain-containing protein n=1 Tax=Evansella vedderi TaxID=38282 RepID=A0ABT9ZTX0_9BACI|nr:hypothetical protein [Evansella vedderi]MDQ0254683.1 hypothetical protein [Evansella vedderi]
MLKYNVVKSGIVILAISSFLFFTDYGIVMAAGEETNSVGVTMTLILLLVVAVLAFSMYRKKRNNN